MDLLRWTRAIVALTTFVGAWAVASCGSTRTTDPPPEEKDVAEAQEAITYYGCDYYNPYTQTYQCVVHPGTCCVRGIGRTTTRNCITDFTNDPDYCGDCGTICPSRAHATRTCVNSGCSFDCNAGYGDCNGISLDGCEVNLDTDVNNCGECGHVCPSTNGTPSCVAGVCKMQTCNSGYEDCDGYAENGCEVNTQTDPTHCNGCTGVGAQCAAGQACIGGTCTSGDCSVASAGSPCSDGDLCKGIGTCSAQGTCDFGTPPTIDDNNSKTLDTCDPRTGIINHVVVPDLDTTVATTVDKATAFIYSGNPPLQAGLDPQVLDPKRVAVVRGKISAGGSPIVGATVSIAGHSEYGHTLSQVTGNFDLVVNGGGSLTVVVERVGYLPVRRQVEVPWQQYVVVPEIGLTVPDREVYIDTSSGGVVQGSTITEGGVQRRATLIFQPGTDVTANGEDLLPGLYVRATEYTVGPNGPKQMPAELPASTAYTYAVEYTIDGVPEDAQIGFGGKTVFAYVDNFLGFPVGTSVPVGYFDKEKNAWVPSTDDGKVICVVGVDGIGRADVDTDKTAGADNAGMGDYEREQLASLYGAGASPLTPRCLWRVPITHFSTWDFNFPYKWVDGAVSALEALGDLLSAVKDSCPNKKPGSIIECENQILGEQFPIAGTPFSLTYWSDRTPGRKAAYRLSARVVPNPLPPNNILRRVEVELHVAGQVIKDTISCTPTCTPGAPSTVEWDGKDAYGRTVQGRKPVLMRIGYVYPAYYTGQPTMGGFGQPGDGVQLSLNEARQEITLWSEWRGQLGTWLAAEEKLGGFTISAHHRYDPVGKTVFFGDGGEKAATTLGQKISTYAGVTPALSTPGPVAVAADGTLYIAETQGHRVRAVAPDGTVTTITGTGVAGSGLDQVSYPRGLAVGPDGALYIADTGDDNVMFPKGHRILRWKNGQITVVAGNGNGTGGYTGDGGLATNATISKPWGVAVAGDGTLFIADTDNNVIRRVGPDGKITTFAGKGPTVPGTSGDNALAKNAAVGNPVAVAIGKDGSVYITQQSEHRVRRVRPNGIIETFAGTGTPDFGGDGGPATVAKLNQPEGLAVGQDGSLFIADGGNNRVRRVDPSGKISTVAGSGDAGWAGDGGPATAADAKLNEPRGVAIGADGTLFVGDVGHVRRVAPALPGYTSVGDVLVASDDGSVVYTFGPDGRHLTTRDAFTGSVLLSFAYDTDGLLSTITDSSGNVTTIQRYASGQPFRIDSPFGKRTALNVYTSGNAAGYLQTITNPNNESIQLTYKSGNPPDPITGLLETLTDPKNQQHTFTYDSAGLGRLEQDQAPTASGAKTTLTRTDNGPSYSVDVSTAFSASPLVDLTTKHTLTYSNDGSIEKHVLGPDNLEVVSLSEADGSSIVTYPDGSKLTVKKKGDPRFGLQASIASDIQLSTGGKTLKVGMGREAPLSDPDDLFSFSTVTDTIDVYPDVGSLPNTFSRKYDKVANKLIFKAPTGPEVYAQLDSNGRVYELSSKDAHLAKLRLEYDGNGRVWRVTHKDPATSSPSTLDRVYQIAYRADGEVDYVTDPYNATLAAFGYDAVGRVLSVTQPGVGGNRLTSLWYDDNGNLYNLTPPGKTAHNFEVTSIDLVSKYTPPSAGLSYPRTLYTYMRDGRLDVATLPNGTASGATVDVSYDSSTGRVSGLSTADGSWLHASFNLTQFTYEAPNHPTMPGKLTRIDGPAIGAYMTFTYAGMLPINDVTNGVLSSAITVHREFDNNLRVSNETVNGGWPVAFGYDDDGVLESAGSMTVSRDTDNGLVKGTDLAAYTSLGGWRHVTDDMSYTPFAEPLAYSATWDTSLTPIFKIDYTSYDKRGRLLTKAETINGTVHTYAYTYDAADRLYQYYKDGFWQATYTYDANGNRTGSGWSVDAQDRLSTSPSVSYTYTHNGELGTRVTGGQTTTYTYDLLGNLRTVAPPSAGTIVYDVDAMGRRVKKTVGGPGFERAWAWDGDRIVAELDASGAVTARFVYLTRSNVPDYVLKPGAGYTTQTYRILKDHLGSVRLVVNVANGAIVQQIDYDPWGKVLSDTSPKFQPFGFAGGLYDADTGLVRFGARDYDPRVGRWTAKDPLGLAGGLNVYAYVENDPVNRIDPTGEVAWWAVGAGIGWVAGSGYDLWSQYQRTGGDWSSIDYGELITSGLAGAAVGAGLGVAGEAFGALRLGTGLGTGLLAKAQSCANAAAPGMPSMRSAIGQRGFRDPGSIDAIKAAMQSNSFRYSAPEGRIAGIIDSRGVYHFTEGHHRLAAARELGWETGNWTYLQRLLDNGVFRNGATPPMSGPLPTRPWW